MVYTINIYNSTVVSSKSYSRQYGMTLVLGDSSAKEVDLSHAKMLKEIYYHSLHFNLIASALQ